MSRTKQARKLQVIHRRAHASGRLRWWDAALIALLLSCAVVLLLPVMASARPVEWPAWPPNAYYPGWERQAPRVEWVQGAARTRWLAATYEVRYGRHELQLWADFGGGARLAYTTPCDPDSGALLLTHPWRGPHVACFTADGSLKVIYPTDYYAFAETVLAKRAGADCGLAGVVARSGPVLTYWVGRTRYFAEYYGKGYQAAPFRGVVGSEDGWYFAADGEGDAVYIVADGRRLKAWQYHEGTGWQGGEFGKLAQGGGWRADIGSAGEVVVVYDGRPGSVRWSSYSRPVLQQWWE